MRIYYFNSFRARDGARICPTGASNASPEVSGRRKVRVRLNFSVRRGVWKEIYLGVCVGGGGVNEETTNIYGSIHWWKFENVGCVLRNLPSLCAKQCICRGDCMVAVGNTHLTYPLSFPDKIGSFPPGSQPSPEGDRRYYLAQPLALALVIILEHL